MGGLGQEGQQGERARFQRQERETAVLSTRGAGVHSLSRELCAGPARAAGSAQAPVQGAEPPRALRPAPALAAPFPIGQSRYDGRGERRRVR